MKTLNAFFTLIIGTGLFFLFTGFNERSFLSENGRHDTLDANRKLMSQMNFIPDLTVQLATGEYVQFQKLMDQKNYIYIHVWSGKKGIDRNELHAVDSIAEVYKNKLTVIGLLDEGNLVQLKRLIKKYQLKNIQGVVPADIKKYLSVNEYPCGVLFSRTGKLIDTGMNGRTLATYLEKHVVVSRAKF